MDGISKVWPKWQVVEPLGEGGFGKVYKAKRVSFGDEMYSAIKVVRIPNNHSEVKEMSTSGLSQESIKGYYYKSVVGLVDEIKMMEKLKSAGHVVGIEDFEVVENEDGIGWTIYIRMELLKNVSDYLKEVPVTPQEICKMAIHVLSALENCHDLNIMHRDIKPANIFVSSFGEYKLGDFGVSREVEKTNATMSQKGTKSYMAPEMVRMEKYGKNVDLYALGLTMYELLNHGRMPFLPPFPDPFYPQDREEAMLKRLSGQDFPEIEGIGPLNAIIQKACHKDPEERYQTATQMKKAILDLEDQLEEISFVEEEKEVTMDEPSIELFKDHSSSLSGDETTMGMFNDFPFFEEEKKEEKGKVVDEKDKENGQKIADIFSQVKDTKKNSVNITAKQITDAILLDFKKKEGIDLSAEMLAMGRIRSEAEKIVGLFATQEEVRVDLPYVCVDRNGAKHIDMVLKRSSFLEPEKAKAEKKSSGFIFEDDADQEDLQKTCPHCGKTAYLQFTHGYFCPSCGKFSNVADDEKTRLLTELCGPYLHRKDYREALKQAREMEKLDPDSAQVNLKVGQTLGNLERKEEQLFYYLKANKLDPRDGTIWNNIGVSYILKNDFVKALEYSTKAVELCDKKSTSDWSMTPTANANHAIALEKNGYSKQAFYALRKAHQTGYQRCDDLVLKWYIGHDYTHQVVNEVLGIYKSKLSSKCYFDAGTLNKAIKKFSIHQGEKVNMTLDPSLLGSTTGGLAFCDTCLYFFHGNRKFYTPYYFFTNCTFSLQGVKKIKMVINQQTYIVDGGKDAFHIVDILNEIKNRL